MPYAIPADIKYDERLSGPFTIRQAVYIAAIGVILGYFYTTGIDGTIAAVFFAVAIISYLFIRLTTPKFKYTYLTITRKTDVFFEGEVKNMLSMRGIKGSVVKTEGSNAQSLLRAYKTSNAAKKEATLIGDEASLRVDEAVLYVIRILAREKPKEGLAELENKLREHAI